MKNIYRLIATILLLAMIVQMVPLALAEETTTETEQKPIVQPSELPEGDVCYAYTPSMVADVFRYLDEIYIEKYPEMGLRMLYGDDEVLEILTNFAQIITEGCETDTEKAQAVMDWIMRNTEYDAKGLPYAFSIDMIYSREGNCVTYAQFLTDILRLSGIPAVFSEGWNGDMKRMTPHYLYNTVLIGHAWCFAYLDGQWALLDPLWEEDPITDRDYIARSYYINMVEGVTPVYESELVPHSSAVFYIDGEFSRYWEGESMILDACNLLVNFDLSYAADYREIEETGASDGQEYLYDPDAKLGMRNGQVYRDGWLLVGSETFAYETGVQAGSRTMLRQGRLYYIAEQTHHAFEVLADPEEYDILGGLFTVRPGYHGKPLETTSYFLNMNRLLGYDHYDIRWESSEPEVATVDENGVITALTEGMTSISAHFYRGAYTGSADNYMGSSSAYMLHVSSDVPAVDYSDNKSGHRHQYTKLIVEPTCTREGYDLHTCTKPGCADSYVGTEVIPAIGHRFEDGLCAVCGLGDGSIPREIFPDKNYRPPVPLEIQPGEKREVFAHWVPETRACNTLTPALVSDVFRYLDEVYIEKYPELGIRPLYGDEDAKAVLSNLAMVITQGCDSDTEKAKAIMAWVERNIAWAGTFLPPIDVVYTREGGGADRVRLIVELLKLSGIPAAFFDGWYAKMENVTPHYLFNSVLGIHSGCFAYLDGQWVMLDPQRSEEPITDREYIAQWYYINMVEGVTPVYESELLPHGSAVFYIDGRFLRCWEGENMIMEPCILLTGGHYTYNAEYRQKSEESGNDGTRCLGDPQVRWEMIHNQAYTNGWILTCAEMYAYENGILATGTTILRQGRLYYVTSQLHHAFEVLADPQEYDIIRGLFTVSPGYRGKPLEATSDYLNENRLLGEEQYYIQWESADPEIAEVDENGIIMAHKEGVTKMTAIVYRKNADDSPDSCMGRASEYLLQVSTLAPEPDYSDHNPGHQHDYIKLIVEPTCTTDGYEMFTCVDPGCADSYIGTETLTATGHCFEAGLCVRCGHGDGSLPHEVFPECVDEPEETEPEETEPQVTEPVQDSPGTENPVNPGEMMAPVIVGIVTTIVMFILLVIWLANRKKQH